jgi:arylsulfatase A-like enzyme
VSPSALYRGAKGDATEGGIRVPLIVTGPAVAASAEGAESYAMSHLIDLFATIAGIEGLPGYVPELSRDLSQHLADPASGPVRLWMTAEQFGGPGANRFSRAVGYLNRWKLVWELETAVPQFYDLWTDPMELLDLAPDGDTSGLSDPQFDAYKTMLSLLEETPECADLVDNDFDGKIDLLDPQCVALWDKQERVKNSCGLGFEVIFVLAFWARRRRPARRA